MTASVAKSPHRVMAGLLSEKQSIATGLLIGLIVWTMTRLVNGVTASGTIEYATVYSPTTLADGQSATKIDVTLTNLSRDTTVTHLQVSINDPYLKTTFSTDRRDSNCAFEPPAWAADATCEPHNVGMTFEAPMLVPGTYVRVGIKYTQAPDATHRPIVRIQPDAESKCQLVEPGLQTFVARHETALLLGLLGITFLLFCISVAAGVREASAK
jgi:hypothetical protein